MSTFVTDEQARKLSWVAEQLKDRGLCEESDVLRAVLDEMNAQSARISTAEAAEILAVTQQTIRNWVRAGLLTGGRDATGHFYVDPEALASAIRMRQALPDAADGTITDDEIDAEIASVRDERRATTGSTR